MTRSDTVLLGLAVVVFSALALHAADAVSSYVSATIFGF